MIRLSTTFALVATLLATVTFTEAQPLASRRAGPSANTLTGVLDADATLHDVTFVDSRRGWAVGDRGVVLHTDDGGAHWARQQSGVESPLLSVSFADAKRGWIVGGTAAPLTHRTQGLVLRTINGGETWQPVSTPTLPRLTYTEFFDAANGVAAGYGSSFYPAGLFRTSDGGKSWQPLASGHQQSWLACDFTDPANGLLTGTNGARYLYHDRELLPAIALAADSRQPRSVVMADRLNGWIVGDSGLLLSTNDGGAEWKPPSAGPLPVGSQLRKVWRWNAVAVQGSNVWVAGNPGTAIAHSADAGATWSNVPTGLRSPIHRLEFVDHQHGWAVGALGAIVATDDGGRSWRVQRGGGRASMLALSASPETVSPEILARYSAGEGYRTAVVPLFATTASATAQFDQHRTDEAFCGVAAVAEGSLWTGESPPLGFHESLDKLIAELNRSTDGLARQQLVAKLVVAIRAWRPEMLLAPHERDPNRHAASALIEQLAAEAIRAAADPTYDPQLLALGLPAWQVKRTVGLLPAGERGAIRQPSDEFVTTLGGSPAGRSSATRTLLFSRHTLPPSLEELELVWQIDGLPNSTRDLFAGLNLPPSSAARRVRVASNPKDLDRLRRLTQKRRQLVRLMDYAEGSPVWSAQVVNLTGGLEPGPGGELLYQLAEGYRNTGRHAMAADTLYLLARRYPDHALSEQALTWLVSYYASGEVAHISNRRQAQQARTKPLANVPFQQQPDGQAAADPQLPKTADGGVASLTEDQRLERATMLGGYLEKARPALHAEPSLRFPLVAASRQLGFTNTADRYFAILSKSDVNSAWGAAARAENWLAKPDELPPNKPLVTCKATAAAPHLDGVSDEPLWKKAEPMRVASDLGRDDATAATIQLVRDEDYLYVAIACPRLRDESYPQTDAARTRDADLSQLDRVELSIDVDRDYTTAYQLTVDCRGWTHDACWGDTSWNPRWYVAHQLTETAWTAELAIPWADLSSPEPAVLDTWCLRAVRQTSRGYTASWTTHTGDSPDSFGLMLFR